MAFEVQVKTRRSFKLFVGCIRVHKEEELVRLVHCFFDPFTLFDQLFRKSLLTESGPSNGPRHASNSVSVAAKSVGNLENEE